MQNLSQNQLLTLWSELIMAYNGTNGFGGDTAEIYAFTLQEYHPFLSASQDTPMRGAAERDASRKAAQSLANVCLEMERRYECRVRIEGLSIKKWLKIIDAGFNHRAHVRIAGKLAGAKRTKL